MNKSYLIAMMLLLLISASYAFNSHELPYGVYCTKDHFIMEDVSDLKNILGINFVYGISHTDTVILIKQAGFDVIKWGSPDPWNPSRASDYSCFSVGATDNTSPIRFETQNGDTLGGFLVSGDSGIMLDNLWFGQYPTEVYRTNQSVPKTFYAKVRMFIDTAGVNLGDTLGVIFVHRLDGATWTERGNIIITATNELLTGDIVYVPADSQFFQLCDRGSCAWDYKVKYSFLNSGKTTIHLDSLKCYEQTGLEIVETNRWDDSLRAAVTGGWKNYVDWWWLRDEPRYDVFRTIKKVRDLVTAARGDSAAITALLLSAVRKSYDTTQIWIGLRSFLQLINQDKLVINDYPFMGGNSNGFFTDYTGHEEYDMGGPDGHRGLQRQLDTVSCKFFGVMAQQIKSGNSSLKEFWSSPQCYYQVCDSTVGYDPPNTMYRWRPLSRSEQRLNVYLPLCFGARGLNLWMYHWGHSSDASDSTCNPYSFGFYVSDTERNAPMWDVFANDITPYVKAIQSVYMGLEWQRAYACSSGVPINPPSGNFVSSISAASNTNESNPDLGWFEVGEFTDSIGNPYIMVLNRACSRGMWDSTEAPSITANVRFNPTNLGLGDYVYIIDIARGTDSSNWVGYQDTTYSATMPDGAIPYTIRLRAGEGRLIKVAATSKTTLPH